MLNYIKQYCWCSSLCVAWQAVAIDECAFYSCELTQEYPFRGRRVLGSVAIGIVMYLALAFLH